MHSTYPKRPPHFPSTPSSPTHLPPRINSSLLDRVPHLDLKLWSMRRAPLRGSWRMWGWSLGFGQPRTKSSAFIGVSTKQWSFLKYPCAEERGAIIDSSANPVVWCTFLGSYAGMWTNPCRLCTLCLSGAESLIQLTPPGYLYNHKVHNADFSPFQIPPESCPRIRSFVPYPTALRQNSDIPALWQIQQIAR